MYYTALNVKNLMLKHEERYCQNSQNRLKFPDFLESVNLKILLVIYGPFTGPLTIL